MTRNESTLDRIVRAGLAVVAVVVALLAGVSGAVGIGALVLGAVLAVTAATGFCPLYRLLGISTCRARRPA